MKMQIKWKLKQRSLKMNIKIRSSQVSKIMPGVRKSWLKGTEDYLRELYISKKYGREREISSKYMSKGTIVEDHSMELLSLLESKFYVKNEENFENDWITGTPDIIEPELRDIKSSWDIFTFHKTLAEGITDDNFWQAQSYMDLTGSDICYIDYCLVDTPEQLVEYEKRKIIYDAQTDDPEWYRRKCKTIEKKMKYNDIPMEERKKTFEVKRDEEKINLIHERVELCREWVDKNLIE